MTQKGVDVASREARRALIVEDSAVFRELLRAMVCDRLGCHEVWEAGALHEARRLVEEWQPDVVFVDVRLPDGNGLVFAREVKKKYPHLTVVVCTSHDLPEYRDAALEMGAAHFVPKDNVFSDQEWGKISRSLS